MLKHNFLSLHSSHGKSCHGTVLSIRYRPEGSVYYSNTAFREFFKKCSKPRMIFSLLRKGISRIHYNDHFLHFILCQKVIRNMSNFTLPEPSHLVFSASVLQIEYRITFFRIFVIFGRSINIAKLPPSSPFRLIILHMYCTVRNLAQPVFFKILFRHLQEIYNLKTPITSRCIRIYYRCAIYPAGIIMKSRFDACYFTHPKFRCGCIPRFRNQLIFPYSPQINLYLSGTLCRNSEYCCSRCSHLLSRSNINITSGRLSQLINLKYKSLIYRIKEQHILPPGLLIKHFN